MKMFYSKRERRAARKNHRAAKKAMRSAKKAFPGVLSLRRWLMTRDKKREVKAAYREAKANLKVAKKAYRATTLSRKLVLLTVVATAFVAFAVMSYAQFMSEQAVIAYIEANKPEDVAVLPEDAVLCDPDFIAEWEPVMDAWADGDNSRILFYGQTDDGFDTVSASTPGYESAKTQECTVTGIAGNTLECTAPDGSIYSVDNQFGLNLGDTACLCFLLAE